MYLSSAIPVRSQREALIVASPYRVSTIRLPGEYGANKLDSAAFSPGYGEAFRHHVMSSSHAIYIELGKLERSRMDMNRHRNENFDFGKHYQKGPRKLSLFSSKIRFYEI